MRTRMCALAAGLALALAACSGSSPDSSTTTQESAPTGELTPVTVGVLPIVPSVVLQLGIDEEIFAEHGLEVSLDSGQGGAALVPGVVSGTLDFATSNPLSLMIGRSTGLGVEVVSGYSHARYSGDDVTGVWAMPETGIASPADLAGKTVAVNTLGGQGDVTIREMVSQHGGDAETVQFVELGFPDMPAALTAGNIDAAWVAEPFGTILQDNGAELVGFNYQEVAPGLSTMVIFTSAETAAGDPELVESFVAGLASAMEFAAANEDVLRERLVTMLDMDPELAGRVIVEEFNTVIDPEPITILADLALADGLVTSPIDVADFLPAD